MNKKNTVIVVAYPDRGAGNDPEPFFFFFFFFWGGVGSLSQPRLNIFTVGNMRVMICLGQGGLRSLNASSFTVFPFYTTCANVLPYNITIPVICVIFHPSAFVSL